MGVTTAQTCKDIRRIAHTTRSQGTVQSFPCCNGHRGSFLHLRQRTQHHWSLGRHGRTVDHTWGFTHRAHSTISASIVTSFMQYHKIPLCCYVPPMSAVCSSFHNHRCMFLL